MADGVNTVAYSYLANSPLVTNIWFTNNTTLRMTTTKNYDLLNRLTGTTSAAGGSNVAVFNYAYNSANQRTTITNVDNSRWVYQYDSLGQVISGKKYWSDGTPVAGQQFEYGFDDIGNRKTTGAGGDAVGGRLRLASYTNNAINQITGRSVPGFVNVLGTAKTNATVSIWGDNGGFSATSRKGDYFRGELAATNTASALWLSITNLAVLNNGASADIVTNTVGKMFVPKTPEVFYYDLDGNLTNDGRWVYAWDAENRATSFTRNSSAPTGSRVKLDCQYDSRSRRTQKIVSTWNGSSYVAQSTNKFVYDGWNLVAILDHQSSILYSFNWGTDASGTMQGAGGVGGLISMTVHQGTNAGTYFYCYDGNHNGATLVNATNGAIEAVYELDAFLRVLRATGRLAFVNPFVGSTKFCDWETGLLYYGYRYYDPDTGRWPNRDPIGEMGGNNLYRFVRNNAISRFDSFGLKDYKVGTADPTIAPDAGAGAWDSEEWTWSNVALKQLIVNNIGIVWVGMPDAVNHIQHYFGNSGSDYTIRLQNMINDVPSAKNVYNGELALAQAFVESLSDGKHSITSGSASGGYNRKDESWNWFYAVGGYSAWGKGNATVCNDEYTLEFQYKFYDRYNWDGGKQVTVLGQVVTDQFMGEFHRQGLAREFDMFGAVKKTVKWKKGQAPKVTEGWESEQGR